VFALHLKHLVLHAGALYCAVRNYSSEKDDEVSVPLGSVVEVLRKSDDGWWFIRYFKISLHIDIEVDKPKSYLLCIHFVNF